MGTNRPKIGFFPGVWDLLHNGHIRALKEAKEQCDELIVGVKSHTLDQPHKNDPILSYEERVELLNAVKYVDSVIVFTTEKELYDIDKLNTFKQDLRFVGSDHEPKHEIKTKIIFISRDHDYSTTNLRKKIWEIENKKCFVQDIKAS